MLGLNEIPDSLLANAGNTEFGRIELGLACFGVRKPFCQGNSFFRMFGLGMHTHKEGIHGGRLVFVYGVGNNVNSELDVI